MRSAGFTLIELLVVISIISILSVMGYANYKDFATNQIAKKAVGQIQTYLRLAQSNATTSTLCNGQGSTSWSLKFKDPSTVELRCNPTDYPKSSLILENATLEIKGTIADVPCSIGFPAFLNYSIGTASGKLTSSDTTVSQACLDSSTLTFTVTNAKNSNDHPFFKISKTGAIDVQ